MKIIAQKGTEGIQILTDQAVNISPSTLASRTALVIESTHSTGLNEAFLMKKVRGIVAWSTITAGDARKLLIGMSRGTVSVTSIKSAMENPIFERNKKEQAIKRDVLMETITPVTWESFDGTEAIFDTGMISLGGGQGIPFDEDLGWQWFIWNFANGALGDSSGMDLWIT